MNNHNNNHNNNNNNNHNHNHNHKDEFYTKQILTYMGNKRKFITIIQSIIDDIKKDLGKGREITIGEGFSGFRSHIWNIASPSCTGLLMSHISFLGIFIYIN